MVCGHDLGIGRIGHAWIPAAVATLLPDIAVAHASEGAIVLLLPTEGWISAGVASVALTVLVVALVPARAVAGIFRTASLPDAPLRLGAITRLLAVLLLLMAILHGVSGPPDPARNAMPLLVWPVFWMTLVTVQGLAFDIWRHLNPFALFTLPRGMLRYPPSMDRWPAVLLFTLFTIFLLADPESNDPRRLAQMASAYLSVTVMMGFLFGKKWLLCGEVFTVLMRSYRRVAPVSHGRAGLWGWSAAGGAAPGTAAAVFMLALLAGGSFDGLNETFLWLGIIGVNPLEFPGRSAIILPTIAGLLAMSLTLALIYWLTLSAGLSLAGRPEPTSRAFRRFAPSLLPIAAAYHAAHYLVSLLIDIQWVAAFAAGRLRLEDIHVTTGFLSSIASVRVIWLTQAGLVVGGHVIAVLMAHALAVRAYGEGGKAWRVLAPLSVFMILYTLFGLWLLAAPRGA